MLSTFRNLSKSTIGTLAVGVFGLAIMASFAIADVSSLQIGSIGGMSSSTLAEVGSLEITDNDMSDAMQRRLGNVREQNPEASYATIAGDFEPILDSLIDQRSIIAFARNHGFVLSKRLVDAEIANIPGVRGLGGQVNTQGYAAFLQRERMTDAEVRQIITGSLLQRLLITPAASNAKIPIGVATPYASMLLEQREGQVGLVPVEAFKAGLNPTDAQLQQFYKANLSSYMVPEQRALRIARIGPEQVGKVEATDKEIADYYNAHKDQYAAKEIRVISQAVVPSQKTANEIAARAKGGASFADAAKPAGLSAEDISVGPQTQSEFAGLAGDKVAAAAFGAASGAIIGPIQSDLGWHVVKIDSVKTEPGKSLAQVRDEIAAQIDERKRKDALADLINKVQDQLGGGANFNEAVKAANLPVTTTPLITASGVARDNPSYKFPEDMQAVLKSGFELAMNDEPVVEQVGEDEGFALVAPADIVPAAPAPLANIRDKVKSDWINKQATARARAAANAISAKAAGKTSLAEAMKQAKQELPAMEPVKMQRLQLSEMGQVPPPLATMFTLLQGKTSVVPDAQGRGFFIVKVEKITPGNALNNPRLISEVQKEFSAPMSQELAQEFQLAVRKAVEVQRNEEAIAAAKRRMTSGS